MKNAFEIIPLTVEARGEIIVNNLPEFRGLVREALGNINRDLVTDEDFGQAELDVKSLKAAEDSVRSAAIKAFDDKLKELVDGLNETAEEIRTPRLELEKLINKRKDEVKNEIIEESLASFDIDPKDARQKYLAGLQSSIKGKRTLDSMRQACRIYATTQQAMIGQCRALLTRFEDTHGAEMTMDKRELELRKPDELEIELRRRFEARKAQREKARLEDEAAKAKAEAQAAIREAEAAKQPAAPANIVPMRGMLPPDTLPKPPKVDALPTGSTPRAEWEQWKSDCKTCFADLRASYQSLKHEPNKSRAMILRMAVNEGWGQMNNEPDEDQIP